MTDRRTLRSNGKVAHVSLKGQVEAARYVEGESHRTAAVVADLCDAPMGARDRQILRGERFRVLDTADGWLFGYSEKDGYVGWIEGASLVKHPPEEPTHRIAVARSYGKSTPGLRQMGRVTSLPFGVLLAVLEEDDGWTRVAWGGGVIPSDLYVPSGHLAPVAGIETDPVAVAERLIHSPYLWGGNSAFGIDCSGLVQAGCLTCGIACPGDSDMQEAELGEYLPEDAPLQRGDLLFWKGHVAWVADPDTLLHANAFHMAVAYEPIQDAINRIEAQGDGPVIARKRLT